MLWVIILITSKYWFNYRHAANGFGIYKIVRSMGVPESRIVLLDATDILHDYRNTRRGEIFVEDELVHSETFRSNNLVEKFSDVEVDYRGDEVTITLFRDLLLNNLPLDENSNILLYMTGHGGDGFFKFQDNEELDSKEFSYTFVQMHQLRRYKEILIILDTCQAATMATHIWSPNVITLASSRLGENSYGLHINHDLGVATVDRFTYSLISFFDDYFLPYANRSSSRSVTNYNCLSNTSMKVNRTLHWTLEDFFRTLDKNFLYSNPVIIRSPNSAKAKDIKLKDYFVCIE